MNKYELHIECKACREGRHASCSQRVDLGYHYVVINCTCQLCDMEAPLPLDDGSVNQQKKKVVIDTFTQLNGADELYQVIGDRLERV